MLGTREIIGAGPSLDSAGGRYQLSSTRGTNSEALSATRCHDPFQRTNIQTPIHLGFLESLFLDAREKSLSTATCTCTKLTCSGANIRQEERSGELSQWSTYKSLRAGSCINSDMLGISPFCIRFIFDESQYLHLGVGTGEKMTDHACDCRVSHQVLESTISHHLLSHSHKGWVAH